MLPDFVVIGGQRCGTTSLHESLLQHPEIFPAKRKEVHYFDLHFERGLDWYRANFPLAKNMSGKVTFEATPNYLASAHVPQLMRSTIPEVKFVALLRNPIERTHSSWKLKTHEGSEYRAFETAVEQELAGVTLGFDNMSEAESQAEERKKRWAYMEKSRYAEHFEQWFEFFDRDRFLILQSEALFANPDDGLVRIQEFLGVSVDPSIALPRVNATSPSTIEPRFREYLADYFAPRNERLSDVTGLEFDWS